MVNILSKQSFYILILLFISNGNFVFASSTQPELILMVDNNESMLGRPIRAELYAISLKSKISDIKLSHLQQDFGVVIDYVIHDTSDKRWPNKNIQLLKFKLYPRRTGRIIIHPLTEKNITSNPIALNILRGETGIPIQTLSTISPFERQQIIVQISIESNDSTARLSIKDGGNADSFDIAPLPFARVKKGKNSYALKIGWAITPLKAGVQSLQLPPIEYSISGVSRKQFYLPHTTLNVKPLPTYLPPTITTGKVTIQSVVPSYWSLQTNSLAYWDIKLSANVNNTYQLPALLKQIKSTRNIKFFPAEIKQNKITMTDQLTSTTNYTIPFKALNSGVLTFPILKIQYFDPLNKKIQTIEHNATSVFVFSFFWKIIISIIFVSLLSYMIHLLHQKILEIKHSLIKRNNALILLSTNNIENIKESLKLLSDAEKWPKNTTLSKWAGCWRTKYKTDDDFEKLIESMSDFFYNQKEHCKHKDLNLQLIELIKSRERRKIFFINLK